MLRRLTWLLIPLSLLFAAGAWATTIPALTVTIQAGSGSPSELAPTGQTTEDPDQFTFSGSAAGTGWTLTWDMAVDVDPFVTSNVSIINTTAATQTYTIVVTLPVIPIAGSTVMGGSVQGGITSNATPGTLSTASGVAFYTALIDGSPVATLYSDPTSVSSGAFLSANLASAAFGTPIPSAAGPAVTSSIGIQLKFMLTPGDQATFSSIFVVEPVPEPATLALLSVGLVGVVMAARRRA